VIPHTLAQLPHQVLIEATAHGLVNFAWHLNLPPDELEPGSNKKNVIILLTGEKNYIKMCMYMLASLMYMIL